MNSDAGDARVVNGILISRAAAEDLVGVIDALVLRCRPQVISRRVAALRHQLIQSCTHADASAYESAEAIEAPDPLVFESSMITDTATVASRLGITEAGVRYLCRTGSLVAVQANGRWRIDPESVDAYEAQRIQRQRNTQMK